MRNALIAIAIAIALLGGTSVAVFAGLPNASRSADATHQVEHANPPASCGTGDAPACPGAVPDQATKATSGIMTIKSRSYACDSLGEASRFVLLAKGEQYDGNSDVNQMLGDDVKNGSCQNLYGGVAMVIVNDPNFYSKDLSAVKIKGSDREWFTPTFLMTAAAADFVPPPDWLYADVKHDDNASARPAGAFDPIAGHASNDPATKAEPVDPSDIYGPAPTPAN